jgi:hypothetical protein
MYMNIYEILKEGKTVGQIYGIVAKEITNARKAIDEEEAARVREIKEARKNFINALEDYNAALTGEWFDREAREKLEQLCIETEKEIAAIQHDLKEIEKLKKTPERNLKKPFAKEKTCAVSFTADDAVIKNFIDTLI